MVKYKKHLKKKTALSNGSILNNKNKRQRFRKRFCPLKYISPLLFNKSTNFYYQLTKLLKIVESKESNLSMKINDEDINLLKKEISNVEGKIKKKDKTICVDGKMAKLINNWKPIKKILSEDEIIIKNIVENNKDRISLSCRKISGILKNEYNKSISKSKVHQILKNKLNFSYRKTAIKNSKIITNQSLKMANLFLKIMIRAIKLNYDLIFIDESKIQQINNNLHCWRGKGEYIFSKIKKMEKRNLIMGVSPSGLIYYKITSSNTNTINFKLFFQGLLEFIGEEKKRNSIFILDNLTSHVSSNMKIFYQNNKINILTTVPYFSPFNLIELSFKKLKQKLYKTLYSDIKDAIKDTEMILKSDNFKKSLLEQYYETLHEYQNFILKYLN